MSRRWASSGVHAPGAPSRRPERVVSGATSAVARRRRPPRPRSLGPRAGGRFDRLVVFGIVVVAVTGRAVPVEVLVG
jgi:hypothetical protein